MSVAQTSLFSYYQENDNGNVCRDQKRVIESLEILGHATDREIARHLNFDDPNKVRPRRNELVKMGFIRSNGKTTCSITGKLVTEWVLI
ncbi:MAG: hypothetical protein ACE5ES_01025 [Candidatus Nanoarchaeia archaeon]